MCSLIRVSSSRCSSLDWFTFINYELSLHISKHIDQTPAEWKQQLNWSFWLCLKDKLNKYKINWVFSICIRCVFLLPWVCEGFPTAAALIHQRHLYLQLDSILTFWYFLYHLCSLNLKAQTASCKGSKVVNLVVCRSYGFYPKWLKPWWKGSKFALTWKYKKLAVKTCLYLSLSHISHKSCFLF